MPKPVIFSSSVKGSERCLFSVQERATKDLTIILKHSLFASSHEGALSTEEDRVIEERFSIHCSPQSERTNGVKHTRVIFGNKRHVTYQYTEAIKVYNQFAFAFMRRNSDISDDRYLIKSGASIVSLGQYDPAYFQIVYMVLVSAIDRHFVIPPLSYVNLTQVKFSRFCLTVMWQFMAFSGERTTRTVIPKTFHTDEIGAEADQWKKYSMERMSVGVSEIYAMHLFAVYKYDLAHSVMDATPNDPNIENCDDFRAIMREIDIYVLDGIPFGANHLELLRTIDKLMKRRKRKLTWSG
jgi:hypothetical protein